MSSFAASGISTDDTMLFSVVPTMKGLRSQWWSWMESLSFSACLVERRAISPESWQCWPEEWEAVEKRGNLNSQSLIIEVMCGSVMITRSSATSSYVMPTRWPTPFNSLIFCSRAWPENSAAKGESNFFTQTFPSFSAFHVIRRG